MPVNVAPILTLCYYRDAPDPVLTAMKKVYLFYITTTSCLFLALFAVFALAGLGGPPRSLERPPTPSDSPPSPPPVIETAGLDYPDLKAGVMYSVSHPTTISTDPEGIIGADEELPPGGIFSLDGREDSDGDLWYRVTVNNGVEDYPMYLKAEDLNWQNVQRVRAADMQASLEREELLALIQELFGNVRKEVEPPPPEPEPEPTATEQVRIALREGVTTLSSQGLVTAGLAAAAITIAIVFAIGILALLHRTRRWQKSSLFEEAESDRGEEFYEDTESEYGHGDEF